jgi:ABC-2 type transport system ATP-binding protein
MSNNGISIQTLGLNKTFGPIQAVRNLDLEVASGGRFGFLGPNGAGKTTTVRMLSGLMKPTSGTAPQVSTLSSLPLSSSSSSGR